MTFLYLKDLCHDTSTGFDEDGTGTKGDRRCSLVSRERCCCPEICCLYTKGSKFNFKFAVKLNQISIVLILNSFLKYIVYWFMEMGHELV